MTVTFSTKAAWVTLTINGGGVLHLHRRKGEMVRYRQCKRHGIA